MRAAGLCHSDLTYMKPKEDIEELYDLMVRGELAPAVTEIGFEDIPCRPDPPLPVLACAGNGGSFGGGQTQPAAMPARPRSSRR